MKFFKITSKLQQGIPSPEGEDVVKNPEVTEEEIKEFFVRLNSLMKKLKPQDS